MAPFTATIKICECDCDCDCECCIEQLYSTIEHAQWQELDKNQFVQTPLHVAAAAGKTTLAVEIMNLMPSFGKKLNPQGLSPLHVAIVNGRADTALALAKLDKQLVRVKGKGGLTPLHCAAAAKFTDDKADQLNLTLLAGLLAECPDAVGVLNNRQQTAVHVALEYQNKGAALLLVNWLVIMAKENQLSIKDTHGNTTLHVAARHCDDKVDSSDSGAIPATAGRFWRQPSTDNWKDVLKLLTNLVIVNKENNNGETPLDVAIRHRNRTAIALLQKAGATTQPPREGGEQIPRSKQSSKMVKYLRGHHANKLPEKLTRAYYFITKELTLEMRNTILVVAVLIATATYQGVLQPPGGVYSAEGRTDVLGRPFPTRRLGRHPPGQMVMGTTKYSYFMPTNTLAFMSSTLIIIFVLPDRAFIVILQACLIFMCVSYLLALNFISYYNGFSKILDYVCGCTLGIAFLLKLGYYCIKAYYNEDEWLLRRLGVMINNHKAWCFKCCKTRKYGEMSILRRMRQQYKLLTKRLD